MEIKPDDWYTKQEAADYLGETPSYVGLAILNGDLRTNRARNKKEQRVCGSEIIFLKQKLTQLTKRSDITRKYGNKLVVAAVLESQEFDGYYIRIARNLYISLDKVAEFEQKFDEAYRRYCKEREVLLQDFEESSSGRRDRDLAIVDVCLGSLRSHMDDVKKMPSDTGKEDAHKIRVSVGKLMRSLGMLERYNLLVGEDEK